MQNELEHAPGTVNFIDLAKLPFKGSHITIGNFDGVHLGHQALIKEMVDTAKVEKAPVIVVTFFPNPSDFFSPELKPYYLSTPDEKRSRLLGLGVDTVITFRFDSAFANLSPRAFLKGLKQNLGLAVLVVGENFALGKNRQGTIPVVKAIGEELGFSLQTIPSVNVNHAEISSTEIRRRLELGDVAGAADLLGRLYEISGKVTRGSDRGKKIGLPTANISHWPKKKIPAMGVYATRAKVMGQVYQGMTNIGLRPTFENQKLPNIETHILDFDGNIYGKTLELAFLQKIRDEKKFSGVEAFLAQIERDKVTTRKIFRHDQTQAHLPAQSKRP